jgi:hypothetical protein
MLAPLLYHPREGADLIGAESRTKTDGVKAIFTSHKFETETTDHKTARASILSSHTGSLLFSIVPKPTWFRNLQPNLSKASKESLNWE